MLVETLMSWERGEGLVVLSWKHRWRLCMALALGAGIGGGYSTSKLTCGIYMRALVVRYRITFTSVISNLLFSLCLEVCVLDDILDLCRWIECSFFDTRVYFLE